MTKKLTHEEALSEIVNLVCDVAAKDESDTTSALSEEVFRVLGKMEDQKLALRIALDNAEVEGPGSLPHALALIKKAAMEAVGIQEESEKPQTPAETSSPGAGGSG